MRGSDVRSVALFSHVDLESRIRRDHPLRSIRRLVDAALEGLREDFSRLYSGLGRPSIPPEMLLRAMLLQAFYSIRSERQLMERLEFDLLFRWFVGLGVDDPAWDHSTFSKNRDRLLEGEIAAKFLRALLTQLRVKRLISTDHFSVDGTLIEAWASMKSFKPKAPPAGEGLRPLAHAGPRPVFLHGMWRSGTTFVWSRFRAAEGVTAYFEPLSPALARLTPRRIGREGWRDAMARSRHPLMDQPYFAEYEPLVRGRGVRLYHRSFAADRFARLRDERDPDLEAYIASLLTHAWAEGRRPVLGFVLTGLRMARLRAAFGAYDVHIDRDPLAIWASYQRHAAEGTYNFFAGLFLILERNAAHPLFAPLAERFELRRGLEKTIKPRRFYRRTIDSLAPAESYGLVFWFWLLNLLHAASHADLILDMSLAAEPGYAHGLEAQLRRECGLEVSFEGLKAVRQPRLPPLFDRPAAEADVLDRLPLGAAASFFDAPRVRARLGELAPAKGEVLARALERVEGNPKVTS